jgi:hypothetical protein
LPIDLPAFFSPCIAAAVQLCWPAAPLSQRRQRTGE